MEVASIYLNSLLSETAKKKAVSLHLTVGSQPVWRISTELVPVPDTNIMTSDSLNQIIGVVLSEEEIVMLKEQKQLVIVKTIADAFRFRINIFYQKRLPSLTFFYIPEHISSISELLLPPIVADLARMHSGLLVISGTHGSGKTTTAASIIEQINQTQKRRIISLEKPVEYSFVSKQSIIEQRQIGQDTPSFKDGIRMCLEEDVDVVYVGEMHEGLEEVVPLLIESASGNSLVIVEVNAPNTIKAVDTLLNGVLASYKNEEAARHSLADVLAAVVAQRLLPRRGGGLIPAIEVMLGNTSVKSLIRENKIYQLESIIQTSKKDGMISMDKAIEDLVHLGEVKGEDVGIARA